MSMMCKPMWPFFLKYGSHDMRHTGFLQVNGGQQDPWEMGRHIEKLSSIWDWIDVHYFFLLNLKECHSSKS